jgi:sn-glycerol 3-phosphate transport system substrate-binding protein
MKARAVFVAVGFALVAFAGAACGGGEEAAPTATPETAATPVEAATPPGEPVTISFWHVMTAAPEDTLTRLTEEFNASQERITVSLVFQGGYDDNLNKVLASLGTDDLPAIAQLDDPKTQLMADSGAVVPIQDFIDAEGYDLSDFLPQVLDYYRLDGRLLAMPFNVTNPLLFYNKKAFEKAGLDPEGPPSTLEEVREYSQAIVDAGVAPHGIALDINPWWFEQLLAKAGAEFLNNGNGRDGRATEVAFDGEEGLTIFTWWKDMVDDGLMLNVGRNPGGADHLLALGAEQAEMTIATASALRSVVDILAGGDFPEIELGVAPMPGLAGGTGGVVVGGAALYIMAGRPAEEQQAAWEYIKFLSSAETQAEWFSGSGYVPIRESSHDLGPALEVVEEYPQFQVPVDQLAASPITTAAAGPLMGAYPEVREAVTSAIEAMLLEGRDPAAALADAAAAANAAIEDYNRSVE